MPQPHWTFFAIAVALIAVIEWEEVISGHVPRSALGHLGFALTPVLYVAIAAWMFLIWPLAYAEKIRAAAAVVCADHRGLDESSVQVSYARSRGRGARRAGSPAQDSITLRCNDGSVARGTFFPEGIVSLSPG